MDDGSIEEFCRSAATETALISASDVSARLRQVRGLLVRYPPPERMPAILVVGPRLHPRWVVLTASAVSIGREADNDLPIAEEGVSRQHCRLFVEDGSWLVEDLGSRNGVILRGARVSRLALCSGDVLSLGSACLLFVDAVPVPESSAGDE